MKLLWPISKWKTGAGYGYSTHRTCMRSAVEAAGVTFISDPQDNFDLSIEINRADCFHPILGAKNLFWTNVEFSEPCFWNDNVNQATCLVTCCDHSKSILSRYYTSGEIFTCPLGIDPLVFAFHQRKPPAPDESFRFLWAGYMDTRKGQDFVMEAWERWRRSGRRPRNAELYLKANGTPDGKKIQYSDFILDRRDLPPRELAELYDSAHCFLYPSTGEGFGLGLAEALATGAPSIWTNWSAMKDLYSADIGYPIDRFNMISFDRQTGVRGSPFAFGAAVDIPALIETMQSMYDNYSEALGRGRKASEYMHAHFTWRQSAEKFIAICEEILSGDLSRPSAARAAPLQGDGPGT